MSTVIASDPASHTNYTFTDVGALHNAIKEYGYVPLRADGTPYNTQYLQEYDGYLLDGAPLNVWINGAWLEGQQEALKPYWESGKIPRPPAAVLQTAVEPMPPEVAERTAAAQAAAHSTGFLGLDTGTLLAVGAGLVAILWLSKGGGKGSREFDL